MRFFYCKLKPRYEDNIKLLYTDTDSLILEFNTKDLFAGMTYMSDEYDTSNQEEDTWQRKKNDEQNTT